MLSTIAPDVWATEHDHFMPGRLHFRARMVVVRLPDGGLLLHSPVPIDDRLAAELAALGEVRVLVAPNQLHHLYLSAAQQRYPDAVTWGAPGLAEKVSGLRIDHVLGAESPAWGATFAPHWVDGVPWMSEHAFLHHPSRTLVVTDLFFDFHAEDVANWGSRLFFRMLGVLGRAKQSPLVRLQTKDHAAAARSCRALVALDVDRVVPAHGRVIEGDVRRTLQTALSWMLSGAPAAIVAPD